MSNAPLRMQGWYWVVVARWSIIHSSSALCAVAVMMTLVTGDAVGQASIMNLGDLRGGSNSSSSRAVSADGRSFAGSGSGVMGFVPVIWQDRNPPMSLGVLQGGSTADANAISADGLWVGGYGNGLNADKSLGFLWSAETGIFSVGDLPGGRVRSYVQGVANGGRVAVGVSDSTNGFEAFRWTPDTGIVGMGFLPGTQKSNAYSVSASGGTIVGSSSTASETFAFRWTESQGMTALQFLPDAPATGRLARANSVSANGDWICGLTVERWNDGWLTYEREVAVLWGLDGSVTRLGFVEENWTSAYSTAFGVSDDGQVVVGNAATGPFIWTRELGMRDLEEYCLELGLDVWAEGFQLLHAYDVSADGKVITGQSYIFENSVYIGASGYALTIPAPASAAVGAIALIFASRRRR